MMSVGPVYSQTTSGPISLEILNRDCGVEVQYTNSASLHYAVHTQCLSTLCSTHTAPLYTVQYTLTQLVTICCHNTDYVHIDDTTEPLLEF